MAFTHIELVHNFETTGGFLIAVLSGPMTNGPTTIPNAPESFPLTGDGGLVAVINATDDVGTTTVSGTPPTYTFYLQLPGAPQQVVITAITSGAPEGVIDWDELPLTNESIPPAAPQVIMSRTGSSSLGLPRRRATSCTRRRPPGPPGVPWRGRHPGRPVRRFSFGEDLGWHG